MKHSKPVKTGASDERREHRGRIQKAVRRREAQLQESEERLAHALDAGAIGLFDWNIRKDRAICTDRYFELFGLDPRGRTPSVNDWLGWVHPEDRERIREELRAALEEGAPYDTEYRVIRQDGAVHWVSSKAKLFFDPEGKPCRMIGTIIDVTERKRAERILRESERRLMRAEEIGAFGHWTWDPSRNKVTISENAYRVLGVPPEHFAPDPYKRGFRLFHPDDRKRLAQVVERALRNHEPYEVEFRITLPGGEVRHIVSRGEMTCDENGSPIMFGTAQDITARKRTEEVLRESQAALERSRGQLQALTASLLAAQEEERRRVSRELHDDLNQRLAVLAMTVETLQQQLPLPPSRVGEELGALRDRVAALSDEIRRVAYELHPSILEHLGLPVALKSYCAEFARREGIPVRFRARRAPERVPQDVALALYRVAQEALRNLARHSRASRGTVTLAGSAGEVRLSIMDHGVGFDPEAARAGGGLGLISMEERVRLAGGSLTVKSKRGKGTHIEVSIPLAGSPS